ncbi:hypothetical protein KKA14_07005 [bacterium]|nr:hypothetical protein [bacterium]
MRKIDKETTLRELAIIVCTCLKENSIDSVLTGGAVVSIYSENRYQSDDLDFISVSSKKEIAKALAGVGFKETKGRYFVHDLTSFIVEFPSGPVSVGNKPVNDFNEIIVKDGYLKLLTPTHCVMDRLAAYYYWDDQQSLDQAVLVAENHQIKLKEIEAWSKEESMEAKYQDFLSRL